MTRRSVLFVIALAIASFAACGGHTRTSTNYDDLVGLFRDWRAFQPAPLSNGVPDYGVAAMSAQLKALGDYQRRLGAIDPSGWPIAQQVDYHIVRAEMNGLEFDHRVLKPWVNDPSFYTTFFAEESDQPAREGNYARGGVDAWKYRWPLDAAAIAEITPGVRAIPALLTQAQANLTGDERDLWKYGIVDVRQQSADLAGFAAKLTDPATQELRADVTRAQQATDAFVQWLEAQAPSKTGPSGIGVDAYDWYLKNVQLLPYTWRDEEQLMLRELARAHAALTLEETRNAGLPPSMPIENADEFARRAQAAVTDYMAFLKDHDLLTIHDDMDGALRAHAPTYTPAPREFFTEVDHHDPEVMRTHGYHWFDKAQMVREPHASPIRRGPLLYNLFVTRTEGHATAWEELMLDAGMFDAHPRSRELVYVLLAERAARALGDLRMQARTYTLEDAATFASKNTPRGWLSLQGQTVRGEQHLYLRQPTYGTSYLIGKIQIETLIAERRAQMGGGFTFRRFMDEFNAAGLIPISLIRWQLTGQLSDPLRDVLTPR